MIFNLAILTVMMACMFTYMNIRIIKLVKKEKEGTYKPNIILSVLELIIIGLMSFVGAIVISAPNFNMEFTLVAGLIAYIGTFFFFNKAVVMVMKKAAVPIAVLIYIVMYYVMLLLWESGI